MIRNRTPVRPGQRIVVCHVPEYDLERRLYYPATVAEVRPDGQVMLSDGSRTGLGSCWAGLRPIVQAVRDAQALAEIDARMLRNAR